jgi:transmembrane sensor
MSAPDFRAALREADEAIERLGIPPEAEQRLQSRLADQQRGPVGRPRWVTALVVSSALGAACAALLVAARGWNRGSSSELGGFAVRDASRDLRTRLEGDGTVAILGGTCTLAERASGELLSISGSARVREESGGARVVTGDVEVAVAKRAPARAPARVFVSHGTIEVMGTRFRVEQWADGGRVTLHEGSIVFRSVDGEERQLSPGDVLAWPLPKSALPPQPAGQPEAKSPPAIVPPPTPGRAVQVEKLLDRVAVLRSRGLYRQSADELSRALAGRLEPATRERLSFELGSILTYQLADRPRACAHWSEHRRLHRSPRYDAEVSRAMAHLACGNLTP